MLPPKSSWLSGMPSTIDLDMTIVNSFVAKTSDVLAFVEIGRRDGWRSLGDGQGREVSVLSAILRGREIPRGIRCARIITDDVWADQNKSQWARNSSSACCINACCVHFPSYPLSDDKYLHTPPNVFYN